MIQDRSCFVTSGAVETPLGEESSRDFGSLTIRWELVSDGWQLNATFFLTGQLVGAHSFLPTTPNYPLQAAVGDQRVKGNFIAIFLDAPQLSTLKGKFRYGVKTTGEPLPDNFNGVITFWTTGKTFCQVFGESAVNVSALGSKPPSTSSRDRSAR